MKLNRFTGTWISRLTFVVTVGGALAVYSLKLYGQERGAERLLQNTEKTDNHAPDPAAKRREDEANRTLREGERLRARAKRNESESTRTERRERRIEHRLQLEKFRIGGPERRPERRTPMERHDRFERGRMEQQPRGDGRQSPGEMPEAQRRLHHLQVAVDNLHAAGLHEPAEHIAQEAQRMRQHLQPGPMPQRGAAPRPEPGMRADQRPPQGELEPIREEIRKLHEAIQDLRRRVEELSRERR